MSVLCNSHIIRHNLFSVSFSIIVSSLSFKQSFNLDWCVNCRAYTVRFLKSILGLYLSDCTNMMIMSHCEILVVFNVRLYDRPDELKTDACKKTCPEFSIINSCMISYWELRCTRDRNVGYHEKYMNGGNAYLRRILYAALHSHMKTAVQPVFI